MAGFGFIPDWRVDWTPSASPPPSPTRRRHIPPEYSTFHVFSQLPPELRVRIWRFAAPPQRVIEIRSWGDTESRPYMPIKFTPNPHRPPTILHVCQESRQEGLRLYTLVKLGVSAAIIDPDRKYVPWDRHPRNPNILVYTSIFNPSTSNVPWVHHDANPFRVPRRLSYLNGSMPEVPMAYPYQPRGVYIDLNCDIVYLGPEFHEQHLKMFLSTTGAGHELSGLQYLAMRQDLWNEHHLPSRQNHVREALYALHTRPLKEIYIIPDDIRNKLPGRYFSGKHEIQIQDSPYTYSYWIGDDKDAPKGKTVVEGFQEWFERLWGEKNLTPPKVEFKSVRRNGLDMADGQFRARVWEVQMMFRDMRRWENWNPS